MKLKLLGFFSLTLLAAFASASQVNWSAQIDNGLGTVDGTNLAIGSLLRIGTFTNISDANITLNGMDLGYLDAHFVEFGTAAIGDGFDPAIPAHFAASTTTNAAAFGLVGAQIFLWAFDTPSWETATQHGIFYASTNSWLFKGDTPPDNSTSIDLTELTDGAGTSLNSLARILWGHFGTGISDASGAPLFNLDLVPEPSTYGLVITGLAFLVALRSRRRK
ncbi:MAG TPA: PEP-CTERM sorting domain-containing protein [Verrucomicrobiae bacterium]|nr:PEP-CTERM sorting domain-containing protein [Verrucomicrobiae bacterium]